MNTKASNNVLGHDSFGFTFFFIIVVYSCFIFPKALLQFCLDSGCHVKEKEKHTQRLNCIKFGFGSHALRFDFSKSDKFDLVLMLFDFF